MPYNLTLPTGEVMRIPDDIGKGLFERNDTGDPKDLAKALKDAETLPKARR